MILAVCFGVVYGLFSRLKLFNVRKNTIEVYDIYTKEELVVQLTPKQAKELKNIINSADIKRNTVWDYGETVIRVTDGINSINMGISMHESERDDLAFNIGNRFFFGCGDVLDDDAAKLRKLFSDASGVDFELKEVNHLRQVGISNDAIKFKHNGEFEGLGFERRECDNVFVIMKDTVQTLLDDADSVNPYVELPECDFNVQYDIYNCEYTVKLDTDSGVTALYDKDNGTLLACGKIEKDKAKEIFEIMDKHINKR